MVTAAGLEPGEAAAVVAVVRVLALLGPIQEASAAGHSGLGQVKAMLPAAGEAKAVTQQGWPLVKSGVMPNMAERAAAVQPRKPEELVEVPCRAAALAEAVVDRTAGLAG